MCIQVDDILSQVSFYFSKDIETKKIAGMPAQGESGNTQEKPINETSFTTFNFMHDKKFHLAFKKGSIEIIRKMKSHRVGISFSCGGIFLEYIKMTHFFRGVRFSLSHVQSVAVLPPS